MGKKLRVLTLLASCFFLIFFYVFSREVKRGFLKQTDFNVTVRLQDNISARWDEIWEDVAFFVTPVPSLFLVGLLTLGAVIDVKKKKISLHALMIPLLFGTLIAGEVYGKNVVHHPGPPFFMIKNATTVFPTYYVNEQYSYPSGHAARAVFIGVISIGLLYGWLGKKKVKILCILGIVGYIGIVAIGRIYLGHHWFSDIIGGLVLGLGLGFMAMAWLFQIDKE